MNVLYIHIMPRALGNIYHVKLPAPGPDFSNTDKYIVNKSYLVTATNLP